MDLLEGSSFISIDELRLLRSQELAAAAIKNPFIKLVGCYRNENIDLIQIEVEVELPQHPPIPINTFEQILIWIENEDDIPKVFALRKDFPKTIHQNIVAEGFPAWLCLYEDPWEEINPFITPELFVERIREWLSRAAIQELHLGNQPLEPFLVTNQKVFIDESILKLGLPEDAVLVGVLRGNLPQMISLPLKDLKKFTNEKKPNFLGLTISGSATFTQIISRLPQNLSQLITLFEKINIDLKNHLQTFIKGLMQHYKEISEYGHLRIIVFLHLPKSRIEGGEPETHEYWAFVIDMPIKDVGIAIGVLGSKSDIGMGYIIGISETNFDVKKEDYSKILVQPCSPIFMFTPSIARKTSGVLKDELSNIKIGVIGLGALGGIVVMNLARQGIGKWILLDNDLLLPHNLSRHALSGLFVGSPKTYGVVKSLEFDYHDISNIEHFPINYLNLNTESKDELGECYKKLTTADIILDFSASSAVERRLSIDNNSPPSLSVYLSPSGKYCIASYEGKDRTIRLDDLNQQLMAKVATESEFQDIFEDDENRFQYAGSCRDLSRVMSNDWFLGYAGVISKFIKSNFGGDAPKLSIFKWQEEPRQCLLETPILIDSTIVTVSGKWKIHTSGTALNQMKEFRNKGLPNETGGVLLGKIDVAQKVIYVSYILPSPPDSKEWPFAYIRGVRGLDQEVKRIGSVTKGAISYVGEWHSHPKGVSVRPSKDDKTSLKWLADIQSTIGYPGLLAIIGDENLPNYLLLDD